MGSTLNTASGMNAYALTDRGTWLSFKNRGDLVILVEGDKRLFNQYGVMLVNPKKHPNVKIAEGLTFINWLTSAEGQKAIADYKSAASSSSSRARTNKGDRAPTIVKASDVIVGKE
jgi:tungstate transport system substrate-binding protein